MAKTRTITIAKGITLTGSKSVECYESEIREIAEYERYISEQAQIDKELRAWLADPVNQNDPEYSDIYKDVHGVRPHAYWVYG